MSANPFPNDYQNMLELEDEELTNGGEGANEVDIACLVHHGGRE
jgi:hypothetical protein